MRFGGLEVVLRSQDGRADAHGPLVVLLHGFGAPADDLVPLGQVLSAPPGTRFAFPAAPIDLGPGFFGGRAWWHIDLDARLRAGGRRDVREVPEGLAEARAAVTAALAEIETALTPRAVVLGGFSQGAMLALDVALHSDRPLAGLALLSGTHIAANEWAPRLAARRGLPVFMSHGRQDELLPFAVSEGLRDTLVGAGLGVRWVPFGGGHGIPEPVLDGLGAFLDQTLRAP